MRIKSDMKLFDVVNEFPQTIEVFTAYGLGCTSCAMSRLETIEDGAKTHRVDLNLLIDDLNFILEEDY